MGDFKVPQALSPRKEADNLGAASTRSEASPIPQMLYTVPFWSDLPPKGYEYTLEVQQGGSVLDTLQIHSKPFYLVGRAPICDILLDNDSISRQHAVFQMKKTGEIFLYDLGSTHGTSINGGAPIQPKTYKRIMAGDSIRFGASSKIYLLEGGPDREEIPKTALEQIQKKRAQQVQTEVPAEAPSTREFKQPVLKKRFDQSSNGKKNRFDSNEDDDEQDAEQRMENQLKSRRSKSFDHGDGDDEEEGNISDEERYYAEVDMVADYLGREAIEGPQEDDDFYNRVNDFKKTQSPSTPESHETITMKIRNLKHVSTSLRLEMEKVKKVLEASKETLKTSTDNTGAQDSLDEFMSSYNDTTEEEELLSKQNILMREFETELQRLEKLLNHLEKSGLSNHKASMISSSALDRMSDEYYNQLVYKVKKLANKELELKDIPVYSMPPVKRPKPQETPSHSLENSQREYNASDTVTVNPPQQKRVGNEDGIVKKTMEFHSNSSTSPDIPSKPESTNPKKRNRDYDLIDEEEDGSQDTGYWVAPAGQTGDGRTSLNDKLGY